jgi:NAD(P)H-flavin reductase
VLAGINPAEVGLYDWKPGYRTGHEVGKMMAEYRMTLVDRQLLASDTMAFWFESDDGYFEFRAGQHVDIALRILAKDAKTTISGPFSGKCSTKKRNQS